MKVYCKFLLLMLISAKGNDYIAHKYAGLIDRNIDKYVALCDKVEQKHLCQPNFIYVRFLVFTHPCIVRCYNEIIKKQSVKPLSYLWHAYKEGSVECEKNKFLYEFCHLVFIVFEQFLIHLVADLTGESPTSLQELFGQVEAAIPLDDLIEALEKYYTKLKEIIAQLETTPSHPQGKISKRLVVLAISVIVIAKKLYEYWLNNKQITQPASA